MSTGRHRAVARAAHSQSEHGRAAPGRRAEINLCLKKYVSQITKMNHTVSANAYNIR